MWAAEGGDQIPQACQSRVEGPGRPMLALPEYPYVWIPMSQPNRVATLA